MVRNGGKMPNPLKLTIDGKEVRVPEGTNLIEAARLVGVHIPNLCYLKGMKGIGACRLCLVEIEGSKVPMTACTTRAKEGMSVLTQTERVLEVRRFVVDLILSMHPLDCMTCTKAGVCELQRYAYELGIKESSFTRKKFGYPIDEANPFVKRDQEYCILCGKCVRVCKEQGTNVLDFMGRGVGAKVVTANDKPLQESGCTFCGSCVDVCPVNALLEADGWRKGREWEYEKVLSVCLSCGNSCDIAVSTKDGKITKVNAGAPEGSIERYICAMGRFGFDSLRSKMRLTSPMRRINGELKEVAWEDALSYVVEKLKKAKGSSGFLSSGSILNEDAITLRRLAMDVIGTKNLETIVSLYADADSMRGEGGDLASADLLVLVGLNPSQWTRFLPALDVALRKKVAAGAKFIVINADDVKIAEVATLSIKDDEGRVLASLAKSLKGKGPKSQAATLYLEAKNPLILCSPSFYGPSQNIAFMKGKAVAVPLESNAKGVIRMGLETEGKTYSEMTSDGLEVLYIVGEVLLEERPKVETLIVQSSHLIELAKKADVVLPSATSLETEGTIVDYLGRLRQVYKAVDPPGEVRSHKEIFLELSRMMGSPLEKPKEKEIKRISKPEIAKSVSPFATKALKISLEEVIRKTNSSLIKGSRLLWLEEKEGIICRR
jgi:NADH dehydrogenase/NADH:ubiquinone oxidoreductase subunit G